jgi:DNA repair protein NreA
MAPPGIPAEMCIQCRGAKLLCGKPACPVIMRAYSAQKTTSLIGGRLELEGSSPPSVFIGRTGYPKVAIGPMVPPVIGDTSLLDTPELWTGKSVQEIVDFRSQLVRGMHYVNVYDVEARDRVVERTRELALVARPAVVDAKFRKRPVGRVVLDDEVQPFGPSAPLDGFSVENVPLDQQLEKKFYDTDAPARAAVSELYRDGTLVSQLQRAFSVGAFGDHRRRRFVPTRWSITAVDSMLGEQLMERTKAAPTIDDFRIFETYDLDTRWVILMMPTSWRYELIEAWYPETTWNPFGGEVVVMGDAEFYGGRKTYASIGGCYYAARLAVNELLTRERRQAGVVILRETHPGYVLPVGVWNVREHVRRALKEPARSFDSLEAALARVSQVMAIPLARWVKESRVLTDLKVQRRLEAFGQAAAPAPARP